MDATEWETSLKILSQMSVVALALVALIALLFIIGLAIRYIVAPLITRRTKAISDARSDLRDTNEITSDLTFLKSIVGIMQALVEQLRRSVDNQNELNGLIAGLTESILSEVHASETRVISSIRGRHTGPPVADGSSEPDDP